MDTYYEAYIINQDNSRWGGFQGDSPGEALLVADNQVKQKRHQDEAYLPKKILVFECRPVVSLPYEKKNSPTSSSPIDWDPFNSIPEHT